MQRTITLCADDFGQTNAICKGILQLVENNRLSAVSCMVNGSVCASYAPELYKHHPHIDIGLHLNFTEGAPVSQSLAQHFKYSFPSLGKLSYLLFRHQLSNSIIEAEIAAQIDQFQQLFHKLPDFIDGHQHIHHFPDIRQALIQQYQHYYPEKTAYIRISTTLPFQWLDFYQFPKKHLIALTGAIALQKQLAKLHIPHNQSFEGIYNFKSPPLYRHYFQQFLQRIKAGGLIMCHPGLATDDPKDPLHQSRIREFNYLISNDFIADCTSFHTVIGRFIPDTE